MEFTATQASMDLGGRYDPLELVLGTVFGGLGTYAPGGPGAIGLFRALVSSSALNALQSLFLGVGAPAGASAK
jgi:hypothetical protein